jgi:hypothetical protein
LRLCPQTCAAESWASRITDGEVLALLDSEYGAWVEQQACSGAVLLPAAAGEAATKLIALTGVLSLLRGSEPLAALWSRHLAGTAQGAPLPSSRWNKM